MPGLPPLTLIFYGGGVLTSTGRLPGLLMAFRSVRGHAAEIQGAEDVIVRAAAFSSSLITEFRGRNVCEQRTYERTLR
jgi:hypothetical protein